MHRKAFLGAQRGERTEQTVAIKSVGKGWRVGIAKTGGPLELLRDFRWRGLSGFAAMTRQVYDLTAADMDKEKAESAGIPAASSNVV